MLLELLSRRSVSPPWAWEPFAPAPSRLHVFRGCLVLVLTRASALNCALVDEDASGATRNQVTMRAYTEPRDTRGTTAGQPEGPRRDYPRDCSRGTRGTTRGAELAQLKRTGHRTGHRTGQLKMRPGIELVALRERIN